MLYLAVDAEDGTQRAGIFVRNSGTEEKTGVNVRGSMEDKDALIDIGEAALLFLSARMKDHGHAMARAERAILEALGNGPVEADALPIPGEVHRERLLMELEHKERVIGAVNGAYERTERGTRMLEDWK